MLNYECDPKLLAPLTPRGVEADTWNGRTLVSMVGFRFLDTKLLGLPIPFHRHFEELNLRFYVRRKDAEGWRRGVVFVKEVVPRRAIAAIARAVYNENYVAMKMDHTVELDDDGGLRHDGPVEYGWHHAGRRRFLRCRLDGPAREVPDDSEAAFITEHYWGYVAQRNGGTVEYRVDHPKWRVHDVKHAELSPDLGDLYGPAFDEVLSQKPSSAFVAEGSEIRVGRGRRIV